MGILANRHARQSEESTTFGHRMWESHSNQETMVPRSFIVTPRCLARLSQANLPISRRLWSVPRCSRACVLPDDCVRQCTKATYTPPSAAEIGCALQHNVILVTDQDDV
jgi:hypothetical protein